MQGKSSNAPTPKKWLDVLLVLVATAAFVWTGSVARWPVMNLEWPVVYALLTVCLVLLVTTVVSLWRLTRFN
jgi:hypothetical protein